jgi:hypothetical protein
MVVAAAQPSQPERERMFISSIYIRDFKNKFSIIYLAATSAISGYGKAEMVEFSRESLQPLIPEFLDIIRKNQGRMDSALDSFKDISSTKIYSEISKMWISNLPSLEKDLISISQAAETKNRDFTPEKFVNAIRRSKKNLDKVRKSITDINSCLYSGSDRIIPWDLRCRLEGRII